MPNVKTEPNNLADVLKWEQENRFSRETVTVKSGQNLALCEVIGKRLVAVPTTGTAGTNTGNGTCTAVSGAASTLPETFTITCTTAAANGGKFSVVGSKTGRLADAVVGTPYTSAYLNATINDGTVDFAVGDAFTVAVAAGDNKAVALDLAAVDGSQKAAGFMAAACDATAADKAGVGLVRDAIIVPTDLVWPTGITADQKTAALAEMAVLGIVARSEV